MLYVFLLSKINFELRYYPNLLYYLYAEFFLYGINSMLDLRLSSSKASSEFARDRLGEGGPRNGLHHRKQITD